MGIMDIDNHANTVSIQTLTSVGKSDHKQSGFECRNAGFDKLRRALILGIVLAVVGLVLLIVGIALWYTFTEKEKWGRFGIVIDAGGSSTKLNIFEERRNKDIVQVHGIRCEEKGVAAYGKDKASLEKKLTDCLNEAKRFVPKERLSSIPLYFGATAGMRLLRLADNTTYSDILKSVRNLLKSSSLNVKTINTISGEDEGVYGWTAINYLGSGFGSSKDLMQALEMGSTSSQVTFIPGQPSDGNGTRKIKIEGKDYTVYAHSYLCFGRNELGRRYYATITVDSNYNSTIEDPCHHKGDIRTLNSDYLWKVPCSSGQYAETVLGRSLSGPTNRKFTFTGTSDPDKCNLAVKKIFLAKNCTQKHCGINGVYQPELAGTFTAFSAFYYPISFMDLPENVSGKKYLDSTRRLCKKTWDQVRNETKVPAKYAKEYCLSGMLTNVMLKNGLGFPDDKWNVHFKQEVNGKKVTWALGLQVLEETSMSSPVIEKKRGLSQTIFDLLMAVGCVSIILGILCIIFHYATKIQGERMLERQGMVGQESAQKKEVKA